MENYGWSIELNPGYVLIIGNSRRSGDGIADWHTCDWLASTGHRGNCRNTDVFLREKEQWQSAEMVLPYIRK